MDHSPHSITKFTIDEKTHAAVTSKMFKRLGHINDQLYEVNLAKSETKHKEPIILGVPILQYAKLKMLELYYNSLKTFCDTDKYEEMENDTDSLAEKDLHEWV